MPWDLDTFLVALYATIDDLYQTHAAAYQPPRRGPVPVMADSEVLTLLLCAHWTGRSERAMLRSALRHWRGYFPRLLDHSAFNRRARDLAGVLTRLIPQVAADLGTATAAYQVLDGVPVPLARRCRGRRHRLFGDCAGIGRGGSDRDWYYGCELWLAVTDQGAVTGFVLGNPSTDDRWLAEALLCWRVDPTAAPWTPADLPPSHRRGGGRVGPTGPIGPRLAVGAPSLVPYVTDSGCRGRHWVRHWYTAYGAVVLTARDLGPDRRSPARRQFAGWRQVVERVNAALATPFGLAFPGAKTAWGLLTRIAAKLAAVNLGLWLARVFDRPPFAFATLFSCSCAPPICKGRGLGG